MVRITTWGLLNNFEKFPVLKHWIGDQDPPTIFQTPIIWLKLTSMVGDEWPRDGPFMSGLSQTAEQINSTTSWALTDPISSTQTLLFHLPCQPYLQEQQELKLAQQCVSRQISKT